MSVSTEHETKKKQECNINVEGRVSYNFTTEVNELHSL